MPRHTAVLTFLMFGATILGLVGLWRTLSPLLPQAPQSASQTSGQAGTSASEGQSASSEASATRSGTSKPEASKTETSSVWGTDADPRNEDFAVSPDKTDWNYESNGEKVVYLTFDDGPSDNTSEVLDILDQYDCKATFFVVGLEPDYYDMISEAYKRGHTIGMHTYSHDYATVYASTTAYYEDLDAIARVVKQQIGYVPCFIRFPGGSSNTISASYTSGIMTTLAQEVQEQGYQYYDWNVSCGDGAEHTADELVDYATSEGEGVDNIILLLHDSTAKDTTVEALPRIIEHYQEQGYAFKAIDRSTMVPHHGIGN